MKKKILFAFLLGIFIVLLGVQTVSAVPPLTNVNTNQGYTLYYPQFEYVGQGASFTLSVYASNRSTSLILPNTDITCYLRLFNATGHITFESPPLTKISTNRHSINLTSGNFTSLGMHSYFMWCNSSSFGGEAAGLFEVTPTGITPTLSRTQATTRSIYFLFSISLLLFIAFLFVKAKPPVKWTYFLVSIMFFLQSISILYTALIDEVVNPKIEGYFSFLASASFILFWFAFGILAVLWFLTTLQTLLLKRNQKLQESYQ